jgi:aryl-alcohol dehydrogenase-like predicted oxidoreductase
MTCRQYCSRPPFDSGNSHSAFHNAASAFAECGRGTAQNALFDTAIASNRAKLDAVEQLAEVADQAGLTMIQLALGFVTAHPAVTSANIGPRTLDHVHSQIAAADTVLSAEVLDAIDAIVTPGVDLAAHEKNDTPPALLDPSLRRR